ncbi:hypothetical protein ACFLVR_02615 [Chloroflexota bacterium]
METATRIRVCSLMMISPGWSDLLKEVSGAELNMRLILKDALHGKEPSVELAPVLNGVSLNWMNMELVSLISRLGVETATLARKMEDFVKEIRQMVDSIKKA